MEINKRIYSKSQTKEYSKEHYYKRRRLERPVIYKIEIHNNIYIGSTIQTLRERIRLHCSHAFNDNSKTQIGHFIRKTLKDYIYWQDLLEYAQIIETCDKEVRYDREKYWIIYYNSNLNKQFKSVNNKKLKDKKNYLTKKGESHPLSKLNDKKVKEIKKQLKQGVKGISLSKKYNVSPKTITNIKHNRIWKDVI
jgi:hypothetical protein